jgi:rare lipoprotein A (peptidoglycan hydrolase)
VPLIIVQASSGASRAAAPAPTWVREPTALPPRGYYPAWQLAADRITTGSAPSRTTAQVTQSAAPTSVPPVSTTAAPAPTTTSAPPAPATTTTTTPAPITTTSAPPAPVSAQRVGVVTYYDDPGGPGTCASPALPFGTVVTITNPANGATARCRVNDREADTARQIDLDTASFAQIAPLSQGVINADLSW